MTMRLFSHAKRAAYLGPYPLERLARSDRAPEWRSRREALASLGFERPEHPKSIANGFRQVPGEAVSLFKLLSLDHTL